MRNLPALFFLYLKDFPDDAKKTQSEIEFLRQTPFFAFSKEQEKKAVNFNKNYYFFRKHNKFYIKLTVLKIFLEKFDLNFENSLKKLLENLEKKQENIRLSDIYKGNIYKRHENLISVLKDLKK